MAEYFFTIQEHLILQESNLSTPSLSLFAQSEGELIRWTSWEGSIWVVLDRKEWKGQKKLRLPTKEGKRKNITEQIKIIEDELVPLG